MLRKLTFALLIVTTSLAIEAPNYEPSGPTTSGPTTTAPPSGTADPGGPVGQSDLCAHKLLVIGLDGFRYDYLDHFDLVNLKWLTRHGSHAVNGLRPAFVTKTLPNFWTLVTGMYQENHGIIDNTFYDPVYREKFKLSDRRSATDSKWWSRATPIWLAAQRAGKRAGVYFWPGSEAAINGSRPHYYRRYNDRDSPVQRVNTVASWLANDQVDLGLVYFNEPDHTGHRFGAWSAQVKARVTELDNLLSRFLQLLQASGCLDKLNLMVVSDHGMTDIRPTGHILSLGDYVDVENDIDHVPQAGTFAGIVPRVGRLDAVYNQLKVGKHWQVYFKDQLPVKYRYKNNVRVTPILVIPDEGYVISKTHTYGNKFIGQHGYDNDLKAMRPLFIARGPAFKEGHRILDPFDTVHLFPVMCHALKIDCPISDGNFSISKQFHGTQETAPREMVKMKFHVCLMLGLLSVQGAITVELEEPEVDHVALESGVREQRSLSAGHVTYIEDNTEDDVQYVVCSKEDLPESQIRDFDRCTRHISFYRHLNILKRCRSKLFEGLSLNQQRREVCFNRTAELEFKECASQLTETEGGHLQPVSEREMERFAYCMRAVAARPTPETTGEPLGPLEASSTVGSTVVTLPTVDEDEEEEEPVVRPKKARRKSKQVLSSTSGDGVSPHFRSTNPIRSTTQPSVVYED
ncbi:Ectonucleotide pyrophosphatase/phosphodiesterase family member 5 [Halotydeus destructor]|nr:Ectonucleotide pyrophosphatase/phosphodiesterase family member 5 [Halotydeus destructor]